MTLDYAVNQVLTRLAEEDDESTIAELPDADGSSSSPIITTRAQVIIYLGEGQRKLAELGLLQIRSEATENSVSAQSTKFADIADADGRNPLRPVAAQWTVSSATRPLMVIGREFFEKHLPTSASRIKEGTPERLYFAEDHLVLWPAPSAAGTLLLSGLFHPKAITDASPGTIADVPTRYEDLLIAFACMSVARQRVDSAGLAQRLPIWEAEWARGTGKGGKIIKEAS